MKKVFAITGILVCAVFAALWVIPTFFKSDILQIIRKQSSRHLRAEVQIGDMSLSLLRRFPNLNVLLRDVVVLGEEGFAGDTVVSVPLFEASVNLRSLMGGDEIIVNRILLRDARLHATVDTAGNANWELAAASAEAPADTLPAPSGAGKKANAEKSLRLSSIAVENLYVNYRDYATSTYASVSSADLRLSGNFSEAHTMADVDLRLRNISFREGNNVWVNRTDMAWIAEVDADLAGRSFHLRKNKLAVNDLRLELTGDVRMLEEGCDVNLRLDAPDTKFESLLALVPQGLQSGLQGVEAGGEFRLHAEARGVCRAGLLPAFTAVLAVNDASLQYPELPESVRRINLALEAGNPGGSPEATYVDLRRLSFEVAGNPFELSLRVDNPADPLLKGGAKGTVDFTTLRRALPLEGVTLRGTLAADVTFDGKYEYIEREEYEKFIARGSVLFNDVYFAGEAFPEGIYVPGGEIIFSPARLQLKGVQAQVRSSDFRLEGYVGNYLPYLFKDGTLTGDFSLFSEHINLNEFMQAPVPARDTISADTASSALPTAAEGALEIPRNVNIRFTTRVRNLLFDRLAITDVTGQVTLANAVADLRRLSMKLLKGNMVIDGKYDTRDPRTPAVDFRVDATGLDLPSACRSFTFLRRSLPIAMNCEGSVSAAMRFAATLDSEMSPVMATANGDGTLESAGILLKDNPALKQLAGVINNKELAGNLGIGGFKIAFRLENGNIVVSPFRTTLAGNPLTVSGRQSVEGGLDYTLSIDVDRRFFGKDIEKVLASIPGSKNIRNLEVDARIGGTLTHPVIQPDLSKAIRSVTKEAEKELRNGNILNSLHNLFKKR